MTTEEAIRAAKRLYRRDYRERNRGKINAYQRRWCAANPARVKAYQDKYWTEKAKELNLI